MLRGILAIGFAFSLGGLAAAQSAPEEDTPVLAVQCVDGTSDVEGPGVCVAHGGVGWLSASDSAAASSASKPVTATVQQRCVDGALSQGPRACEHWGGMAKLSAR